MSSCNFYGALSQRLLSFAHSQNVFCKSKVVLDYDRKSKKEAIVVYFPSLCVDQTKADSQSLAACCWVSEKSPSVFPSSLLWDFTQDHGCA